MKIAKGIVGIVAGSVALVGCSKPAPQTNPPPPATPAKVGSPTDPCGIAPPVETFTMKVNPNFHVIRTGPVIRPNKPHPHPGQLDTYTALQDGQSAQITIQLLGKMTFDGGASSFQLKSGEPLIFCGLTSSGGDQTLSFMTYRKTGGPTSSAYSLVIVAPDPNDDTLTLKMTIDPVVDNDGFQFVPPKP